LETAIATLNSTFMIKKIEKNETECVHKLIEMIIDYMDDNNIEQWIVKYNLYKEIAYNIENSNAFGYYIDKKIVGLCILNDINPINQSIDLQNDCSTFVHFLLVHPKYHRQGIATKLIQYCEESITNGSRISLTLYINALNDIGKHFCDNLHFSLTENIRSGNILFHKYEKFSMQQFQSIRHMHFIPTS